MSEALHAKLRRLREQQGIAQADLAQRLYMSRTSLTALELGKRDIRAQELFWFADIFGVEIGQLLDGVHVTACAKRPFRRGDRVRLINPASRYYEEAKDLIGTYESPFPCEGQPRCCNAVFPGITGPYEHPCIVLRESDLEFVEVKDARK